MTDLEKEMRRVRSEKSRRSARPASQNSTLHSVAKPSAVTSNQRTKSARLSQAKEKRTLNFVTNVSDERRDSKYGINPT